MVGVAGTRSTRLSLPLLARLNDSPPPPPPPLLHAQSAVVEHEMALMDRRHMGSAHAALPALPFPTSATLGSSSAPGSRGGGGFHESRSAR